jgi:hypothetical protein
MQHIEHTERRIHLATTAAHRAHRNDYKVYENLKVRHHLQDIEAEDRIILKWILTERMTRTRFIRLRIRANGRLLYVR